MSDVFEGPGWWMASDGHWYAPELHADSAYRDQFATVEPVEPPTPPEVQEAPSPQPVVEPIPAPVVHAGEVVFPAVKLSEPPTPDTDRGTPVSEILNRASAPAEVGTKVAAEAVPTKPIVATEAAAKWSDKPPSSDAVFTSAESADEFTVSAPWGSTVPDVPRFEAAPPASVVEAPGTSPASPTASATSQRARLDLPGVHGPSARDETSIGHFRLTEAGPAVSTDLVLIPELALPTNPGVTFDRVVAAVLFASGLALIVGTFLSWTNDPAGATTGWERGDGFATILSGVLGASAAGPIFVGYRHLVPKTVAIAAGVVAATVMGLVGADTLSDSTAAGTSIAAGFWLLVFAAFAMIAAGIADRSQISE